jgi:hypothetical protein
VTQVVHVQKLNVNKKVMTLLLSCFGQRVYVSSILREETCKVLNSL